MIENEKKYFGGWWIWILLLVIFTMVALTALRAGGLVFWTAVEREVFEQSYQRSAAEQAKFNMLNAELTGAETRLRSGGLTASQRSDLEAQAAALRLQINAMEN